MKIVSIGCMKCQILFFLMETICMKCQILFSGKNKKNIINLSSAELAQREVKVKYEGCSKWIAYFYLETSNFKLAQKYSFHALEVLPMARNAKFQPM